MARVQLPIPQSNTVRLLIGAVAFLVIVIGVGTVALKVADPSMSVLDSLYAALNTVTTVGRGMTDFSSSGKMVMIGLMVVGIATATIVLGLVNRAMVEGQIQTLLGRKRMEKQIEKLSNHVILCGYGRMGRYVAAELDKSIHRFVVIEHDETAFQQLSLDGRLAYKGDAASDEALRECGVERARALISVTSSDADNVFVALSARQMNPNIYIVARANEDSAIEKLHKAGANRVFSPYRVGGRQMALAALRPNVIDFLTEIGGGPGAESYQIEELRVEVGSPVCGHSLRELNLSRDVGAIIIGLRRGNHPMIYNPSPDLTFEGGDIIIALVPTSRLSRLAEMVAAQK